MTPRLRMAGSRPVDLGEMAAWEPSLAWLAIRLGEQDPETRDSRALPRLRTILNRISEATYVVVEEIVDDTVGGSTAPWPRVDTDGRLRFAAQGHGAWSSELDTLQGVVDSQRTALGDLVPYELATRPIEVGDVFAMLLPVEVIASSLRGGNGYVLDVTWDARQAGKVADLRAHETPDLEGSQVARVGADAQMRALAEHRPVEDQDLVESEVSLDVDARFLRADDDEHRHDRL